MDLSEGDSNKKNATGMGIFLIEIKKEHRLWLWGDQREGERCSYAWKRWRHTLRKRGKAIGELQRENPRTCLPTNPVCIQMEPIPGPLALSLWANPGSVRREERGRDSGRQQWHPEKTGIPFPTQLREPSKESISVHVGGLQMWLGSASSSVKWVR